MAAERPVWIYVRKTVDWDDAELVAAQLPEVLRDHVALWDTTFAMPWHAYRAEVKRIATACAREVQSAQLTQDWAAIPRDAIVLPCDDDDWHAPHAARVLAEAVAGWGDDSHDGAPIEEPRLLSWPQVYLETYMSRGHRLYRMRRRLIPWWRPRWSAATNSYAVIGPPKDRARAVADNHAVASRAIDDGAPHRPIAEPLGVVNRTLASHTQLSFGGQRPDRAVLLAKHARYTRLYARRPPRSVPWSAPHRAAMAELHARLRPR